MNEDIISVVNSVLSSYWYNRTAKCMVRLIKEVISRVNENYETEWTDDGDIIFGILVLMFGDYGVSPRAGWIDAEYKQDILKELQEELKEYEGIVEREED